MKKIYFALALIGMVNCLWAQPVLNAGNFNPIVGENADEYDFDTTGFDPGAAGVGASWSYPVVSGAVVRHVEVYSPLSTPHAPSFPSANIAISRAALNYDYYLVHAGGIDYYGNGNSTETVPFSDPAKIYTYPFTYLSECDDSLHAVYMLESGPVERKGRVLTQCDAYGTLTTPTGTYIDVLRVKSTWAYEDILNDAGDSVNYYFETRYCWVRPGYHFPLLTYIKSKTVKNGVITNHESVYYLDPASITAINDEEEIAPAFTLYPNPVRSANADIWFNSETTQDVNLILMNASGQEVFSNTCYLSEGNNHLALPVANLEPGIYFVELVMLNGKAVRKLVVG